MNHIETLLNKIKPDYVGLSLTAMNAIPGITLTNTIKKLLPDTKIIIGGILATSLSAQELADFHPNAIIRGEGEALIVDVLKSLDASPDVALLDIAQKSALDVDTLGWPSREMLPWQLQQHPQASISSSRGCPFHCSFCSIPRAGKINRWRPRNIEDVVEEILFLNKRHGVYHFYFVDDNFIITTNDSYNRAAHFAELILQKAPPIRFGFMCRSAAIEKNLFHLLKNSGLSGVFLGIESFSQAVLDRYKKRETVADHLQAIETLNSLAITINPGFIFFDQWTTKAEVNETIEVMGKIDFPSLQSINSKLTCYRGTLIEKEITPSSQKTKKPGIIPYEIKETSTQALFETCYDLFYKDLPSIKEYCTYQMLYYSLGYILPYYLNTDHESFFVDLYNKCARSWKTGDLFILQSIKDIQPTSSKKPLLSDIKLPSIPYWENGNKIAKMAMEYSAMYFTKQITTDPSENIHLSSLFFTLPQNKHYLKELLNLYASCQEQNKNVIARLLSHSNNIFTDLSKTLAQGDNIETILEFINSALISNNYPAIQSIDKHLSIQTSRDKRIRSALDKARHIFSLSHPEQIIQYGRYLTAFPS